MIEVRISVLGLVMDVGQVPEVENSQNTEQGNSRARTLAFTRWKGRTFVMIWRTEQRGTLQCSMSVW